MSDRAVHTVTVLVVLVGVLVVAAATPAGAFEQSSQQVEVDPDSTRLTADIQPDGDARWEIAYRVRLDSDNETAAFEDLQQDIENDSTPYTDRMERRMQNIANDSAEATGREMTIRNVTVETRNQVDYGLVVYRFEWTNFAAVDGETLTAGDAIDQFYLSENRSLWVRWPEGYEADSVSPTATTTMTDAVAWEGELSFDPGQPRVVLVPEGQATTATPTDGTGGETTAGDGDTAGGNLPLVLGAVVVAVVVGAAIWLYTRREGTATPAGASDGDDGTGAGGAAGAAAADGDDGPPPELLSNEERLLKLLEQSGGRMKQKEVADQLDWTAAKTSQVVGDLRDEGELDSFRLGRENVLTLPDVEIDAGDGGDDEGDS